MSTNCATIDGTARYIDRFVGRAANGHFREAEGHALSSIGIGTYLGDADAATDENYANAVARAVQLGANVIDTAANYRFQRSERSIGGAIKTLAGEGFQRDELMICTKGGYLPFDGEPPRNVREYVNETFVKPGIAAFDDFVGGSHCMTPSYLQNQLDQSLRNMDLDCVDVYYIHNPESQLGQVSEAEFYHRITIAFERLEANRQQGKLGYYGVATWNGFRTPADSENHHSLVRMFEIANAVGGDNHGFRFIQLPFNLAMPEALSLANEKIDGEPVTVLEAAFRMDVSVMVSASMLQGRVARGLPDNIRQALGSLPTDAQTAIQFVRSTPGITTALVGMSSVEHVEENLALAETEPAGPEAFAALWE
ncbi:MAG TPA: aldo/keto reductase [Pyrinomonadaceae bacterium]|nr:aldo/keto reductase [Pyrinomonadaceae bacterium]